MAYRIVIPNHLPPFASVEDLKDWLNDARYKEPTHKARLIGRPLYDKERNVFFHPLWTKLKP